MKKLLLFLLLTYKSTLLGQTILTSFPLDLTHSKENNQILTVENIRTHNVFVFATDKKNITILKYNSALFLTDQYSLQVNQNCKSLIGYSFGEDGNPTLYWSSEGFNTILIVKYYLENKTCEILNFKYSFWDQDVVASFQKNNMFYILSKYKYKQALNVHTFRDKKVEERIFDFSGFKFQNQNTQFLRFNQVIIKNPIEKIEVDDYNPLYKSTKKSKVYMLEDEIILTLDHNSKKTQVFELNLKSHDLNEKTFIQSSLQTPKKISNSFYQDGKLYQINASESELLLDIKDFNTSQTIKSVKVSENETISETNSPLVIQKDNRKPIELKKTKKFLEHLFLLDIGLSVFKKNLNTLIAVAGTPKEEEPYKPSALDYEFFGGNVPYIYHTESVYFESILDSNFEFIHQKEEPHAIDNIFYFLNTNKKITSKSILKFKDFYILGYYDDIAKQYIMRKFTDGFF